MDPVVVTTAGRSGSEDRKLRQKRYAQKQGLRLVVFLLAVVLPVPLPIKLVLITAAFALTWGGVLSANAAPKVNRSARPDALVDHVEPVRIALEPGRDLDA